MDFTGEFETHITVSCSGICEIDRLQQWSLGRNLKFLHILLDRGVSISQPMLTRRGRGNFADEFKIANEASTGVRSCLVAFLPSNISCLWDGCQRDRSNLKQQLRIQNTYRYVLSNATLSNMIYQAIANLPPMYL